MDFGTTTTTGVTGTKGTIQFDKDSFYWTTTLKGIRFGGATSGSYGLKDATVQIDSGRQCLYVPEAEYEFVHATLLNYSNGYYLTEDGETVVDCGDTQTMQNIQLLVNTHWVEIAQNDYLNAITTEYNGGTRPTGACRLCLKNSWDYNWHIGSSALVGYYTEFDYDEAQISFTPLSAGTKLEVVEGEQPDRILGLNLLTVGLLSAAIAVCMITFVLLIMAMWFDTNVFSWLIPGGDSTAQAKKASNLIEESKGVSMEQLEKMIENALLKKSEADVNVNSLI